MFVASWDIVGALQAGRGWAMDLRFPSVFSEDVTMWMDADCGFGLPSLVPSKLAEDGWSIFTFPLYIQWGCNDEDRLFPPGWQRMSDGSSLSLCIQWGCNDVTLVRELVTMALRLAHWVVLCFTLDPMGWLGSGHHGAQSAPSSRDVVASHYGK